MLNDKFINELFKRIIMRIKLFLLLTFFYTLTSLSVANEQPAFSGSPEINAITVESQQGKTVLVFDVNGTFDYKVFTLTSPDRLVIDISNISNEPSVTNLDLKNSPINKIRIAQRGSNDLRVVLDLEHEVSFKHFQSEITYQSDSRLVIDLYDIKTNNFPSADKSDQKNVMPEEQAAIEQAAKERAAIEKTAKERAAIEKTAKERATKEQAAKEKALSSQSKKNQVRPLNNEQYNFFVSYGAGITYSNNCKPSFAGEVSAGVKINEQFSTQISHISAYCYQTVSNRTSFNTTHTLNELSFRYTPQNSVTFFEYGLARYNLKNSPSSDTPVLGVGMKYDGTYWNGDIEFKIYPGEDDIISYTGASLNSYF